MSIAVTPGSGATVDADVIAGVNTQAVKIRLGATGVDGGLISGANPLPISGPVTQSGTWTVTQSGAFNVGQTGTWAVRNQDGVGNALASSTTAPAGTEQALIVRNIPSGTQAISGTVTANAGTGTFGVSGTVTANAGTGTFNTADANLNLAQAVAITGLKGNMVFGSVTTAAPAYTTATANALSLNTSGGLRVDGSGVTQPISGTVTITPPTGASATQVQGTVAHGVAAAQNPVQMACETRTTNRAVTADAQASRPIVDKLGRQIVKIGQPRELQGKSYMAYNTTTTAEATMIAAGGVGVFNDITFLIITPSNNTATAVTTTTNLTLRDGTAGTINYTFRIPPIALNSAGPPIYLALPQGPLPQAVANSNWTMQGSNASIIYDILAFFERTT
jgi:hypothetical protein